MQGLSAPVGDYRCTELGGKRERSAGDSMWSINSLPWASVKILGMTCGLSSDESPRRGRVEPRCKQFVCGRVHCFQPSTHAHQASGCGAESARPRRLSKDFSVADKPRLWHPSVDLSSAPQPLPWPCEPAGFSKVGMAWPLACRRLAKLSDGFPHVAAPPWQCPGGGPE